MTCSEDSQKEYFQNAQIQYQCGFALIRYTLFQKSSPALFHEI